MNKHEEAKKALEELGNLTAVIAVSYITESGHKRWEQKTVQVRENKRFNTVHDYITQSEATEKVLDIIKDMARKYQVINDELISWGSANNILDKFLNELSQTILKGR